MVCVGGEGVVVFSRFCECTCQPDRENLIMSILNREVDTALRPGAFALLDACSGNDLQQLHAALGGDFYYLYIVTLVIS